MRLETAVDVVVDRFETNPLVTVAEPSVGDNVNGPSVIAVPEWLEDPLGSYYMYFAHHGGSFIRLAYADDPRGPWRIHPDGTLHIDETRFDGHIASPDVHVDHDEERVRLYFHGCCGPFEHPDGPFDQVTDVATSQDGLSFTVRETGLGNSYFRVWEHDRTHYAIANDGHLYRSDSPLDAFERRQELFPRNRHVALRWLDEETLQVFLTRRGDRPERIQVVAMDLAGPDEEWRADPHPPETVCWPEREYEGGQLAVTTGQAGPVNEPVRALRDPAIFEAEDTTYLYYAIAGERGIAGAEIRPPTAP
jgi:hypothetical protein